MPTCPNGHDSADEEFCEVCGLAMDANPVAAPIPSTVDKPATPTVPTPALCPACDSPLDGRFCEVCGHDSLATPPPREVVSPVVAPAEPPAVDMTPVDPKPRTWTATVSADRAYYNQVMAVGGPDAGSITFPAFCPDRYFPLHGNQITIGRHSATRGIAPNIDLTGPPEDPGVSHLHAMFVTQPDGTLSIVDLDSSNGTTINDDEKPLRPHTPHPLTSGDRIHLGAWTTITVRTDTP